MREERDTAKSELNQLKEELAARDKFIVNLQAQLGEKEQAIATLQAQSQQQLQLTLPFITDSLDPAVTSQESEVISHQPSVPSDELPVNSQELEVISQQSPVISEEQPPAVNSQPSTANPKSKQKTKATKNLQTKVPLLNNTEGTLSRGGLWEHIKTIKSEPTEPTEPTIKSEQDITDAIRDKHKNAKGKDISRLACFEKLYGFKYIGKIGGQHRFVLTKS